MYITDRDNHRIRKVTVSTGIITTIAGSSTSGSYSGDNGAATSAKLYYSSGVALDSSARAWFYSIFKINLLHDLLSIIPFRCRQRVHR